MRIRVELQILHHIGKGLGVAGDKCGHLVLASLTGGIAGSAGDKLGNQRAIGLRRQPNLLLRLSDGQIGGKAPQAALGLASPPR